MSQLKRCISSQTLKIFYSSHILPHISYSSTVWGGHGETHLNKLNSLHHRAAKLLLLDKNSSTDEKMKALSILPLQKQLYVNKAVLIFKVNRRMTPSYVISLFTESNNRTKRSWWSLSLEDDIICASYLWVREWLCRPILDLQSRVQSGHWKFAFVAGIQAAKWRRSLADCAWWRRSSSSADDADCVSVRQHSLFRAVATSSVGGMPHHCKPAFTVSLKRLQGRPCLL